MSHSSGQQVTTTPRTMECDGTVTQRFPLFSEATFDVSWPCTFTGVVDVLVDPETQWAGWSCPRCGTEHPIEWEDILGGWEDD